MVADPLTQEVARRVYGTGGEADDRLDGRGVMGAVQQAVLGCQLHVAQAVVEVALERQARVSESCGIRLDQHLLERRERQRVRG